MKSIHQINESNLGTSATPDDARAVAAALSRLGYQAEYSPVQGVDTDATNEDGESVVIPDEVWDEALGAVGSDRSATTVILAEGKFERGADILRNGEAIYRVPACTHWDDDAIRVIARDGEAVVQVERREYSGCRSWGTDEWTDVRTIGPVEGLVVCVDIHGDDDLPD